MKWCEKCLFLYVKGKLAAIENPVDGISDEAKKAAAAFDENEKSKDAYNFFCNINTKKRCIFNSFVSFTIFCF